MKIMANFGCGPDPYESNENERWYNFDKEFKQFMIGDDYSQPWDLTVSPDLISTSGGNQGYFVEHFDGGVINHVLCTMNDYLAHKVLTNIHRSLKPGGELTVIDMDLNKVIQSYQDGRIDDIPIEEGSIDDRLCFAISGYGTRKSLYTIERMRKVLEEAGFRIHAYQESSKYDTRPKESLVFKAIK